MSENIHVLDTNVILRFFLADHAEHFNRASSLMEMVRTGDKRAFVPESVLAECVYVLLKVYDVPRAETAEKLIALLSYRGMQGDHVELMVEALRLFRDRNISIVDAVALMIARHHTWTLETFDKDLAKLV